MYLVLSSGADPLAAGLSDLLERRHGRSQVTRVNGEELVVGATWDHRLGDRDPSTTIELADGRLIRSAEIRGVLNRLRYVSAPLFNRPKDSDYSQMETFALTLSWLASLRCHVINSASPRGLSGPELTRSTWLAMAAKSGLPTIHTRITTNGRAFGLRDHDVRIGTARIGETDHGQQVALPAGKGPAAYMEPFNKVGSAFVVGRQVFGPPRLRESSKALARRAACSLLEVRLGETTSGRLAVTHISPHPRRLPQEAAEATVDYLTSAEGTT